MSVPRLARIAGRLLADERDAVSTPPPEPEQRARAIAAIERALHARARRRWFLALGAAAAAVALALGFAHLSRLGKTGSEASVRSPGAPALAVVEAPGEGASLVGGAAPVPVAQGESLPPGARLVTRPNGRAALAFSTGTQLSLDEATDMTVVAEGAEQVLALASGALHAHVEKLAAGERFVVRTPDAEVEVRGTSFQVAVVAPDVGCGAGTRTRVEVYEGVVAVRHAGGETRLAPGDSWPPGCAPAPAWPPPSPSAATQASSPVPAASASAASASSLADQNDLFARAVAAKRRGATGEAVADFDRFLAKYPSSPLAESAAAEKMRLLRGRDHAGAQAAARSYLARWPGGFARAEAEAILGHSP